MLDLIHSIYWIAAGVFCLVTFFCMLFSYSTVYEGIKLWEFKKIKERSRLMPIRACMVLSNFAHWFAVTGGYFFPMEVTWMLVARATTLRLPVTLASIAILIAIVHIQNEDWSIYHNVERERKRVV